MRHAMGPLPCETRLGTVAAMGPRRNRVDPWGDLVATPERGLFTGNRGCLVDGSEQVVRHHQSSAWITCRLKFKDRRVPLARPNAWTPIFFLDDAVALAAGHRPCGECRHADHHAYQRAVSQGLGRPGPVLARELDRRLAAERLRSGRGLDRASDRQLWEAPADELPDGTVIIQEEVPQLLLGDRALTFSFAGWHRPHPRPPGSATVLTPPTSVLALASGFRAVLHPSALDQRGTSTGIEIR